MCIRDRQMTMDVTVVLYFLLFLFIFLYEITPPIPQILPIIAGVLSFADFILISFVFLIASSGVTLAAVSYTHLDVYKRQAQVIHFPV